MTSSEAIDLREPLEGVRYERSDHVEAERRDGIDHGRDATSVGTRCCQRAEPPVVARAESG